jgi:hypothetical protein
VIRLRDGLGSTVGGKTITLAGTGSATISGGRRYTDDTGAAVFTLTNLTAETATFTATDARRHRARQARRRLRRPSAAAGGISASPNIVTANGSRRPRSR